MLRIIQGMVWLYTATIALLMIAGSLLMSLWVGHAVTFNYPLLVLLCLATLLEAVWRILVSPAVALNRHIRVAIAYITINVLAVGLAYMCAISLGLIGVALALLAAEVNNDDYSHTRQCKFSRCR